MRPVHKLTAPIIISTLLYDVDALSLAVPPKWHSRRSAAPVMDLGLDVELVGKSAAGLAAFAIAFRTGAAFAVVDQPRLPSLSATYRHVGVRYTNAGGARVKVFYPASSPGDEAPAPYCTDGRETSDGMAGLVGFRQLGLSFLLAHLADARSGTWLDAPPAPTAEDKPPPILVYSHGFGGNMDMASYLMRTFAAHGIIVAAVEHTDGTASFTKLGNGSPLPFSPGKLKRRDQLETRAAELLAASQPGALGLPPSLAGGDVFLGGHSYGGPSALLAAAAAARDANVPLRGVVLHDPALGMGEEVWAIRRAASRPDAPTISYVSDEYDKYGVRCGEATFHTVGGFHGNFVDAPLWAPKWVMAPLSFVIPAAGPCDAEAMHDMLARTAKLFMNAASERGEAPTEEILGASRWRRDGRPLLELR